MLNYLSILRTDTELKKICLKLNIINGNDLLTIPHKNTILIYITFKSLHKICDDPV